MVESYIISVMSVSATAVSLCPLSTVCSLFEDVVAGALRCPAMVMTRPSSISPCHSLTDRPVSEGNLTAAVVPHDYATAAYMEEMEMGMDVYGKSRMREHRTSGSMRGCRKRASRNAPAFYSTGPQVQRTLLA